MQNLSRPRDLMRDGGCEFRGFDCKTEKGFPRRMRSRRAVIVEGCSALRENLAPVYDMRFLIESDGASTYEVMLMRDGPRFEREWREMFLPSTELCVSTNPAARGDQVVAGRGARSAQA